MKVKVTRLGKVELSKLKLLTFDRERHEREHVKDVKADDIEVIESAFDACTFSNMRTRSICMGAGRRQSTYTDCVFENCRFTFSSVGNVRLLRCRFESCQLEKLFGVALEVIDCAFPGTMFRKAVFHGTADSPTGGRERNEFRGNDFSTTRFIDADFRGGIDLTDQRLPLDDDYFLVRDLRAALAIAKTLKSELAATSGSEEALGLITVFDHYLETGQRNQLLRVGEWGLAGRELRRRLMA